MSSQSIRKPGAVCQNIIGPAGLAVSAVKDPLSEPFPGPPLGRVGPGIAPKSAIPPPPEKNTNTMLAAFEPWSRFHEDVPYLRLYVS